MVKIDLKGNNILVTIEKEDSLNTFNSIVRKLKVCGLEYNTETTKWKGSWTLIEDVADSLEDITEIKWGFDITKIEELIDLERELRVDKVRRSPDYTLMNFKPIMGKGDNKYFQHTALQKCINQNRYFCAWGMGSGKSYIIASTIAHRLMKYGDATKALILTTPIGVRNLYFEMLKFIKGLREEDIVVATSKDKDIFERKDSARIIVMSYPTFSALVNHYKKVKSIKASLPKKSVIDFSKWLEGGKGILFLDESHSVANPTSQRGGYVALHAQSFEYRYLFSGTPADVPEKLYNQFKILDNYLVYGLSFASWKSKMAYIGTPFSAFAVREWKKDELEKQNKRFTNRYGSYFDTTDLVDLPEYREKRIYLKMTKEHRNFYETFVTRNLECMGDDCTNARILSAFPFLSVSLDNPFALERHRGEYGNDFDTLLDKFKESYLEKFKALDDIIESTEGQLIVWCLHPKTIEMLGERYKKLNPICIDGSVKQEDRFILVDEFKKNTKHKILIANITSLATSVTITTCTTQVYLERNFNYSDYKQSTQRIYRLSQNKDVTTYIPIYEESIDVFIDKALQSKGELTNGLLSKNFLSQEQWVKIFNMRANDTI